MDEILNNAIDFGSVVRKARKMQGLTQEDLAGITGVSRRFVVELESGKPTAQIAKAIHVITSLGISLLASASWSANTSEDK